MSFRFSIASDMTKSLCWQCNNQESGSTGQGMKTWTMVANTDSLLDDESRKAIMLLRGLKGTHLFIPRIGKFIANHQMF